MSPIVTIGVVESDREHAGVGGEAGRDDRGGADHGEQGRRPRVGHVTAQGEGADEDRRRARDAEQERQGWVDPAELRGRQGEPRADRELPHTCEG